MLPQLMISHSLLNRKKMYLCAFLKLKAEFCSNQPSKEFYKIQPSSIDSFTIRSRRQISFTTPNSGHRSVSSLSLGRMYGKPAERTCSFLLLAFVNKHKHIHWERAEVVGESCLNVNLSETRTVGCVKFYLTI